MDFAKHGRRSRAIIFPFMAQGHTLPLIYFAKLLSHKGLKITIITTPSNSKTISSFISSESSNISTHLIPFPVLHDLPQGCENTKDLTSHAQLLPFLRATRKLKQPFGCFLREMVEEGCHPISVVYDFFLDWVLPVCSSFNIPAILFHGMGVLPTAISRAAVIHSPCIQGLSNQGTLEALPGLTSPFPLTRQDFPHLILDNDPVMRFFYENYEDADDEDDSSSSTCWGVLVNSFEELEGEYVDVLGSLYNGVKVWCVGPLHLYEKSQFHSDCPKVSPNVCKTWLDQQEKSESVVFVSFGTQSLVSSQQMDEFALGLDMAGYPFIWAVGSKSWSRSERWEKGKGLMIREWVDQRSILEHPSIGGFVSHCGWNSVVESLSRGVPMLTCPMSAEQPLNAKLVTQVVKAGISVKQGGEEGKGGNVSFGCDAICCGIEELMGGEKGRLARERAKEIGDMASRAVEQDGSSSKKLDQLIRCLTEMGETM